MNPRLKEIGVSAGLVAVTLTLISLFLYSKFRHEEEVREERNKRPLILSEFQIEGDPRRYIHGIGPTGNVTTYRQMDKQGDSKTYEIVAEPEELNNIRKRLNQD